MSETQIESIFSIIGSIDRYLNTVDLTKLDSNIFLLQLTELLANLMINVESHLKQHNVATTTHIEDRRVIPSSVVALFSSFVRNVELSNKHYDVTEKIISLLKVLQPNIVNEIGYVNHILTALSKLEKIDIDNKIAKKNSNNNNNNIQTRLTLDDLRSTFIALPFHLESTKVIVQILMDLGQNNDSAQSLVTVF